MTRAIVVVPTYNEAENIPLLVPQILAQDESLEVIIVDDASPDGTGEIADTLAASESRVHVLHRPGKQGLGPAYRAGLAQALELGADFVIQMDADFSHPPTSLPQFLEEIENHDVVLGSRYLNGITVVNWPIERILISWFGNVYTENNSCDYRFAKPFHNRTTNRNFRRANGRENNLSKYSDAHLRFH